MIFSMHQPNYLPWLGYFDKIARSDVFVVLDAVQYPRGRSFASRNRILTPQGPQWLTMPVSVPKDRKGLADYTEITLADLGAPAKHLRTLEMAYGKAPGGQTALELYEAAAVTPQHQHLVDLNMALIEACCSALDIDTRFVRLSDLEGDFGNKSQLIVDIAQAVGADTYLSGDGGGRDYNDDALLAEHGVNLDYQGFTHPTYEQPRTDEFEAGMCVIDLLASCGSSAASVLRAAPTTG